MYGLIFQIFENMFNWVTLQKKEKRPNFIFIIGNYKKSFGKIRLLRWECGLIHNNNFGKKYWPISMPLKLYFKQILTKLYLYLYYMRVLLFSDYDIQSSAKSCSLYYNLPIRMLTFAYILLNELMKHKPIDRSQNIHVTQSKCLRPRSI